MNSKKAIIIGAGPAGLTAAFELLKKTDIKPIIIEKSEYFGGISRTINYHGNRIDLGGHRFFSKSKLIIDWWLNILPQENKEKKLDPDKIDQVMLVKNRKSRIYFDKKFFEYPINLSLATIHKLGFLKTLKIGGSYLKSTLFLIKNEGNLEQFFINRFGYELYSTFFKDYTEKVWGLPCYKISAEWGKQRIKGLSLKKAILHFLKKTGDNLNSKSTETSLIEKFLYPKFGPGQLWEEVARKIKEMGGEIITNHEAKKIYLENSRIKSIEAVNLKTNDKIDLTGEYFFSTMPIDELVKSFEIKAPNEILRLSNGLIFRNLIIVGLLLNKLKIKDSGGEPIKDNWIYIQEPSVFVGRIQIFNNWSPYILKDPAKIWLGLEYYCFSNDELWKKSDPEITTLAMDELDKIQIIDKNDVIDATVIRVPKAYPAYFGAYGEFYILKNYFDRFDNLFLIGRNGMYKYNNMDHSMLAAITAVDNIIKNRRDKSNIWAVNTEQEYHEIKLDNTK